VTAHLDPADPHAPADHQEAPMSSLSSDNSSDSPEPAETHAPPEQYRDAFRVADELAVHGSDCVCPRCAGRLPGLLAELSRAIERDTPR
jgi:hypothetical protein